MNIGFDLDEIFVSHPPFIPSSVILKLYGERANGKLSYRIPGWFEQQIRKLSHISFLRPPLQENINLLREASKKTANVHYFLISSRYGFLNNQTKTILKKYKLANMFGKMYFNYDNQQPHLFKKEILQKERLDKYIDDDLPLLQFLAPLFPRVNFFWLNKRKNKTLLNNLHAITNFSSIFNKL